MSRGIKFRAWLKNQNKMIKVIQLNLTMKNVSDCFFNYYKFNEIELMQYTNLKDKYGVEIYEGDIIIFISEKKGKKYTIGFDEEDCSFSIFLDGIVRYQLQKSECHDIKVIGNIYVNKELLENEKTN